MFLQLSILTKLNSTFTVKEKFLARSDSSHLCCKMSSWIRLSAEHNVLMVSMVSVSLQVMLMRGLNQRVQVHTHNTPVRTNFCPFRDTMATWLMAQLENTGSNHLVAEFQCRSL
jgi:hypothetical protein